MAPTSLLTIVCMCMLLLVTGSDACCPPDTMAATYCATDYFIMATILNETKYDPLFGDLSDLPEDQQEYFRIFDEQMAYYRYAIDILQVYRVNDDFDKVSKVIEAYGSPTLCGLRFIPGKTYVIMGWYMANEHMEVVLGANTCGVNIEIDTDYDKYIEAKMLSNEDIDCNAVLDKHSRRHYGRSRFFGDREEGQQKVATVDRPCDKRNSGGLMRALIDGRPSRGVYKRCPGINI